MSASRTWRRKSRRHARPDDDQVVGAVFVETSWGDSGFLPEDDPLVQFMRSQCSICSGGDEHGH